jgi:hypothetical protein
VVGPLVERRAEAALHLFTEREDLKTPGVVTDQLRRPLEGVPRSRSPPEGRFVRLRHPSKEHG